MALLLLFIKALLKGAWEPGSRKICADSDSESRRCLFGSIIPPPARRVPLQPVKHAANTPHCAMQ